MIIPQNKYEFWWLMTTGELPCPHLYSAKEKNGYILVYGTYNKKTIQEKEHRIVMEEWLCRKLSPKELVHHINGNRLDNRLENLVLCTAKNHLAIHRENQRPYDALSLKEIAAYFGICDLTLRIKIRKQWNLSFIKICNNIYYFKSDIQAWIERQRNGETK